MGTFDVAVIGAGYGGATVAALLAHSVLAEGESPDSARVLAAAGHAAPVLFHFALENERLDLLPNGEAWAAAYADVPAPYR